MATPVRPAAGRLAGLHVEGHAEAERRARIGVVARRHAEIHDAHHFLGGHLLLFPHLLEKALDAPVVLAFGESPAARLRERVVLAGLALRPPAPRDLFHRVAPILPATQSTSVAPP